MRDFGFAFNDRDLSDRVLHLEIISDESDCKRKLNKENGYATHSSRDSDSNSEYCSTGVKVVKTLHISSPLLAEKSPFFYKLFKNGMRESQQRQAILRIDASEEAALMDLLHFMYSSSLRATTVPDLLNVLLAADKFEIISCMRYCSERLLELPMSLQSAQLYLGLSSSVSVSETVQPLKDAAKQYLVEQDITKSEEELMVLPLSLVEVLLGSGSLRVKEEDNLFDFILKWAHAHYPKLEERREIVTKNLAQFICFKNLSCSKLKEVLVCPDFDQEEVTKLVLEALFSKIEVPYGQHIHPSSDHGFGGRRYRFRLIKVDQFEHPWPRCVVYFDLKKEDCARLFPTGRLLSQPFCLGGKWLMLMACCMQEQQSSSQHFGLFVQMKDAADSCTLLDFEFAAMEKPSNEFQSRLKVCNHNLRGDTAWGGSDMFLTSWTNFMSDNSRHFFDGILHLRAELAIKHSQP